jgi:hypothetical protein
MVADNFKTGESWDLVVHDFDTLEEEDEETTQVDLHVIFNEIPLEDEIYRDFADIADLYHTQEMFYFENHKEE